MSVPTALFLVALLLALVAEFQAEGKSLTGWAVVAVCLGLLYGNLPL